MKRDSRARLGAMAMFMVGACFGTEAGCGSSAAPASTSGPGTGSSSGSSGGYASSGGSGSGGSGAGSSSGSSSSTTLGSGDDGGGSSGSSGDDGGSVGSSGEGGTTSSSSGSTSSSGSGGSSSGGSSSGGAACVRGQVSPNQVVLIGDSYLDPAYSNAALDLYTLAQTAGSLPANTTYRHYYQGGAAMANGALQFNIPYQYESQAKTDLAVMNPANIDTIIMDGGGNDVLIDQQSCLTSPPPGNTACTTTITGATNRAGSLLQEMASNGVRHIVYFFYPHLDPAGGGILPTPAPDVNVTLDYAYPLAEQVCCGTTFTATASTTSSAPYTCKGMTSGTECIFIDTRPAFEGHVADYIKTTDHVHPTPAGAQVIANLIWQTMVDNCIAQ